PLVLFKPVAHRDALPLERCESPRSNPLQMVAARDEDDRLPVVAEALAGGRSDLGIDRKRTPWGSMLISPGVGTLPPPTMPASPVVRRAEGGASTSVARRGSSRPLAPGPSGGSTCLETGTPGARSTPQPAERASSPPGCNGLPGPPVPRLVTSAA